MSVAGTAAKESGGSFMRFSSVVKLVVLLVALWWFVNQLPSTLLIVSSPNSSGDECLLFRSALRSL